MLQIKMCFLSAALLSLPAPLHWCNFFFSLHHVLAKKIKNALKKKKKKKKILKKKKKKKKTHHITLFTGIPKQLFWKYHSRYYICLRKFVHKKFVIKESS